MKGGTVFCRSCPILIKNLKCKLFQLVKLNLEAFDAVVVMSHHLENDSEYLRQVSVTDIPYIGLLGPASRRERL